MFTRVIETTALDWQVRQKQKEDDGVIKQWLQKGWNIERREGVWWKGTALVVTQPNELAKGLMETFHDSKTAGHPGTERTYQQVSRDHWWPELRKFIRAYVKGCGVCQQNKAITHPNKPPLHPIDPPQNPDPFKVISVDLIVKLPKSQGYDAILTITDQGSTKAVVLIPCKEEMGTEDLARLYKERAFPYIGLPSKLISDRDVRFTSGLFKEICKQLGIQQNMSSAYHPQTDGESERTNQTVETALRIFGNFRQDDWSEWLPLVQYHLNSHVSNTTRFAPFDLWMGYIPRAHQPDRASIMPEVQKRKEQLFEARKQAQESMKRAQQSWVKETQHRPYQKGQRVWLEGKNLKTSHPTAKLRPKRFGPFAVTEVLGPTTYRLELPPTWKIHNAFHGALLSPYHETMEHGENFPEPPPELVERGLEYEVGRILKSRRHGRGKALQFLVHWKGYSTAHDSWEPKENIHAPDLVRQFYEENPMAIRTLVMYDDLGTSPLTPQSPSNSMDSDNAIPLELYCPQPELTLPSPPLFGPGDAVGPPPFSPLSHALGYEADKSKSATPTPTPKEIALPQEEEEDDGYPGPPWFRWQDIPGHPPFQRQEGEVLLTFPFLRYLEKGCDTYIVGCMARGQPAYYKPVLLRPVAALSTASDKDPSIFVDDSTFNFPVNQALDQLDDPALLAEVARYRALNMQLPMVVRNAALMEEIVQSMATIQKREQEANRAFLSMLDETRRRLEAGQARPRVEREMVRLAQQQQLGGRFYWMGLPGMPEHPNRHYLPDYLRRRNEEQQEEWGLAPKEPETPPARKKRVALETLSTRQKRHRCRWCRMKGHYNKACPVPHLNCSGRCKVPKDHAFYIPSFCELPHHKPPKKNRSMRSDSDYSP